MVSFVSAGASALHQPGLPLLRRLHPLHVSRCSNSVRHHVIPRSALADAFNTLGRKFIYAGAADTLPPPLPPPPPSLPSPRAPAATIVPLHELESAPPVPEGSTPSPFVTTAPPPPPAATSRLAKLEAAAAEVSAASSYSRWGQPAGQHMASHGRGGQGGRKRGRNDRCAQRREVCRAFTHVCWSPALPPPAGSALQVPRLRSI